MPGERPTHAVTIHPRLVEMPLWLASRTVHIGRWIRTAARSRFDAYADAYPDTAVGQLHVAARMGIAACLLDVIVQLIT